MIFSIFSLFMLLIVLIHADFLRHQGIFYPFRIFMVFLINWDVLFFMIIIYEKQNQECCIFIQFIKHYCVINILLSFIFFTKDQIINFIYLFYYAFQNLKKLNFISILNFPVLNFPHLKIIYHLLK